MYCLGCNKEHYSRSWKYSGEYDGWVCAKYHNPTTYEFIPDRVRDEREEYFNSTLQPYRSGELSKEYIEAHGTKGIDVTEKEIKKAKNVWSDLKGFKTRKKSK